MSGLAASTASEDQNLRHALERVDALFSQVNVSIGTVRYHDVTGSDAETGGWREQLAALEPVLAGNEQPLREIAGRLGMSEGALRVALHRLRRRFADCIRRRIADTVSFSGDIDGEIAYLMKAVGRGDRA